MLDIRLISVEGTALDVVSLAEMKAHLRLTNDSQDEEITAAITDAVDALHGIDGKLNRSIFRCRWIRWLPAFPCTVFSKSGNSYYPRRIALPYPPLRQVVSVFYEDPDGASPVPELDPARYVVRTDGLVGEVELISSYTWPRTAVHPRAVGIMYDAGYETYPAQLKRLVKILAADFMENREASINDRILSMSNRKTAYGIDFLMSSLRVPWAQDDWDHDA